MQREVATVGDAEPARGKGHPRTNIVFVTHLEPQDDKKADENTERDPVALLEVGKVDCSKGMVDLWYQKFGHGMKYIDLMTSPRTISGQKRKPTNKEDSHDSCVPSDVESSAAQSETTGVLRVRKPLLSYTIVCNDEETYDSRDEGKEDDESDDEERKERTMMIGCFFCEPKFFSAGERKGPGARLALMYKYNVKGEENVVVFLSNILKQIFWFKTMTRGPNSSLDVGNWEWVSLSKAKRSCQSARNFLMTGWCLLILSCSEETLELSRKSTRLHFTTVSDLLQRQSHES